MSEANTITHIQKISVRNFRALREIDYEPKQINILTGRNNTGKTALLDAIELNFPGSINSMFEDTIIESPIDFIAFGERSAEIKSNLNSITVYPDRSELKKANSSLISEFFEKLFQSLFEGLSNDDMKKVIENKQFQDEYLTLFSEYYDFLTFNSEYGIKICPYLKQKVGWGKQYLELSKKMENEFKKLYKRYSEKDTAHKNVRINSFFYRMGVEPEDITLHDQSPKNLKKIVKLDHYKKLSFDEISEEDLVVLTEFIQENNVVKNLKRLSQTDVVYQRDNSLVTIPISAHGDGFKSLLNTVRYLVKAKDSILFIEEPENHLHPRYVDIFVENLFEYSKKLNVQIFMSTHSLDLIRSALKYPESDEEKEMLLISKMTSDGQNVEKFDYTVNEGLKVIDELYLDLRGN